MTRASKLHSANIQTDIYNISKNVKTCLNAMPDIRRSQRSAQHPTQA